MAGNMDHSIAQIQQLRQEANIALRRRDIAAYAALMTDTYVILPGSHGLPVDKDRICSRLQSNLDSGTLLSIIRTCEQVDIAFNGRRAAERGRWTMTWEKPDGKMHVTGVYQATWILLAGTAWRLLNESFVTLSCSGSVGCEHE